MADSGQAERKTRVFLSYSRKDGPTIVRLAASLEAGGDIEPLIDKKDILAGEEWRARLEGMVVAADVVLVCLSSDSIASPEVAKEIEIAQRLSKKMLPVVVRSFTEAAPNAVASLNYFFLTNSESWDAEIASLRTAVHTDIGWLREHTRISELAQQWQTDGKRPDELLRGAALDEAERWLAGQPEHATPPSPLQIEYLTTGRRAASRRQRNWAIGSTIVAAVAIGLSIVAYWQRGIAIAQRTEATARRLSAEAQLTLSDTLARGETAVRNLLVSLALAPADDARQALAAGTNRLAPKLVAELPWPDGVKASMGDPMLADDPALAFSDDGAWIGTVSGGEAFFWNVQSRKLERRYRISEKGTGATLQFVPGHSQALISQSPNAWTFIDLTQPEARTVASNDALDVHVAGSAVWMLAKAKDGGVSVVDLADDKTIVATLPASKSRTITFGRIVEPQADPLAVLLPGGGASRDRVIVLVDDKGAGTLTPVSGGTASSFQLPAGAQPIALGALGPALAIKTASATDQAINLPSGKPVWQAAGPGAHIQGFAGDGRFLVVGDEGGVRIETLGGGGLLIENSRRTDYDANAMNDLSRYTPIVAAGVAAENPHEIVTALKDGRITVWDATLRPRYGGMGGMPSKDFESLARFDHGETLGAQVGWIQPPTLFVSPSGRYVASQSLGLRTNSVGGVMGADPLVRIWDRYRTSEIARFWPRSAMIVAFAPTDDRIATIESRSEGDSKSAPSIRLAVWDIRAPQPEIETSRRAGALPLTPPVNPPGPPSSPLLPQTILARAAAALWVGFDLKVRAMNPDTGAITTIDDVKDAIIGSLTPHAGEAPPEGENRDAEISQFLARLGGGMAASPEAPIALALLAASGDGRRAVLLAGASARLYALDGPPRLLRVFDLSPWALQQAGFVGGPAMSRDGDAFAITVLGSKSADKSPPRMENLEARHLVFSSDAAAPTKILHGELLALAPFGAISRDQLVALGPSARTAVIDEIVEEKSGGRSRYIRRAVVRDLTSEQNILTFPDRELTIGPGGLTEADGSSGVMAGFDATGSRLAMATDAPNCPMTIATNMTWMSVSVPSCPERRIKIEFWNIGQRKKTGATSFVMTPEGVTNGPPAAPPVGFGALLTVDLPDPSTVALTGATFNSVDSEGKRTLAVELTQRLVPFGGADIIRTAACERLPREVAEPNLSAWMALVPNEGFRPICPQAPAGAPWT